MSIPEEIKLVRESKFTLPQAAYFFARLVMGLGVIHYC
jgi:hypothetical protein